MTIEINREEKLEIKEDYLVVKDKKLYNTKTKEFEGIDGDIVEFNVMAKDGKESGYRGYVDGYTTDKFVKIRGVEKVHTNVMPKKIEHISIIRDIIDETIIKAETTFF